MAVDQELCLRDRIAAAIACGDPKIFVERIKDDLSAAIRTGELRLSDHYRAARPDRYARRLLHRDDELGYTAVVMTWGPNQGTAIHDHAGIWCVEGVVEGEMEVTQYELEEEQGDRFRFHQGSCIQASIGSAGCLIPPFEHHVLHNPTGRTSITLHIYGGEMDTCSVYVPQPDGWHQRVNKPLRYDA